jgi:MinD-like ATPase involved in chromosome partitioning or flagellar assembly
MPQIISIHSYRRGTGKSSLAANLAVLFAAAGKRAGLIDAALHSPSLHFAFGLESSETGYSLNDYLENKCEIEQTVQDLTGQLNANLPGKVFLISANMKPNQYLVQREYSGERIENSILKASEILNIDYLLIDTPSGINDNALLSMAICDTLVEILRLDQQDYQGAAVVIELARKLAIPHIFLVANFVTKTHRPKKIQAKLEQSYGFDVAAILPISEDMLDSSLRDIFVLAFPQHPLTLALHNLVEALGSVR